jgi:hypothetical protein
LLAALASEHLGNVIQIVGQAGVGLTSLHIGLDFVFQ